MTDDEITAHVEHCGRLARSAERALIVRFLDDLGELSHKEYPHDCAGGAIMDASRRIHAGHHENGPHDNPNWPAEKTSFFDAALESS